MVLPAQWFRQNRAFAIGVVVGGCAFGTVLFSVPCVSPTVSAGGAIATLIMYKTLASFGLKKTYAIYAGIGAASFLPPFS